MTRNRSSARAAGSRFERIIADHLANQLDDRIDRRVSTGILDKGDIGGVRIGTHRLVIECKDCATLSLPAWTAEAAAEARNDVAVAGVVIHKRRGTSEPDKQWVTCTVAELIAIIRAATGAAGPPNPNPEPPAAVVVTGAQENQK